MEIETENSITKQHFVLFIPPNIVEKFCGMEHIFIEFFQMFSRISYILGKYVRVKVAKIRPLYRSIANYKVRNNLMYHDISNYLVCVLRIIYVVAEACVNCIH